jgi:hypothetical protein
MLILSEADAGKSTSHAVALHSLVNCQMVEFYVGRIKLHAPL